MTGIQVPDSFNLKLGLRGHSYIKVNMYIHVDIYIYIFHQILPYLPKSSQCILVYHSPCAYIYNIDSFISI